LKTFLLICMVILFAGCATTDTSREDSALQNDAKIKSSTYMSCTIKASRPLFSSGESPNDIATAAIADCGKEESELSEALQYMFLEIYPRRMRLQAYDKAEQELNFTRNEVRSGIVADVVKSRVTSKSIRAPGSN
jgi:hypothetical protein